MAVKPDDKSGSQKLTGVAETTITYHANLPMSLDKAFDTMSQEDDRFANVLMKALEEKNLEGFDYLEFKQSVAKLLDIGMDHDTALKAAFATGSTAGLTLEKLVKTARYYTEVLQDEKS